MYIHVYDDKHLIFYSRFPRGAVAADNDRAVAALESVVADVATKPGACVTLIISIDEHTTPPDAAQRQRLATCAKQIPNSRSVFITRSALARTIITAFTWLIPSTPTAKRSVHASYEEARRWLLANGSRSAQTLDAVHEEVCRREAALLGLPRSA